MKITKLVTLAVIALALAFAGEGCKKKPQRTTYLPGQGPGAVGDTSSLPPIDSGKPVGIGGAGVMPEVPTIKPANADGTYTGAAGDITGRPQDRTKFQAFTVYFDFDRSTVKSGEASKIDSVATQFKAGNPGDDLLIEGHCDERGTAEYNRSLGERRALAIREYLIRAGVNAEKIHTVSFGKDKPAALGHDESSWSKNRRGEFILVLPK